MFYTPRDFARFLDLVEYYHFDNVPSSFSHFKKLAKEERNQLLNDLRQQNNLQIEIIAFCLMPNHYHFVLKQITTKGITKFTSNLQNGYAKYLNIRTKRTGPLFEPMFKAVRIETDEQLLHVSRYIHLNPATGYIVEIKDLESYPWSSFIYYLSDNYDKYPFVNTSIISGLIKNRENYKEFVYTQAEYQRELAKIKHLLFE